MGSLVEIFIKFQIKLPDILIIKPLPIADSCMKMEKHPLWGAFVCFGTEKITVIALLAAFVP